jgi:hypothetical protein
MRFRFSMSLLIAGLVAFISACHQAPPAPPVPPAPPSLAALDSSAPLLPEAVGQVETASAVMPPQVNNACSTGQVLVTYGQGFGATRMASTNLGCYLSGAANCFQAQPASELLGDNVSLTDQVQWDGIGAPQNFACNPSLSPNQSIPRDNIWFTDDQIIRVGAGFLNVYVVMANHPAKSPVPNRLNKNAPVGCNNPFTTASLAIVTSSDCGTTWKKVLVMDLNDPTFLNGAGTVPEYDSVGNTNQTAGFALDRPEIYVDPYNQAHPNQVVFLTAAVRLGPLAGNSFVVKSPDGGQTWQTPVFLPGGNPGASGNPTVIATTANARVYAFRCEGSEPRLYWSDDYGLTFPGALTIKYQDNTLANPLDCGLVNPANLGGNIGPGSPGIGIARWGDPSLDNVIVTYSAVNNNQQVQPVITLTTQQAHDPHPLPTANILIQGAPGHSIMQATLVRNDRFVSPDGNPDPLIDAAILYWMDVASPALGGQATAVYQAVRQGQTWENQKPLSLQNSLQYSWGWNLNPANPFIGDYNRGSFIFATLPGDSAPTLHFFTTWEQSIQGPSPNILVHSNMVNWNVPPSLP